MARTTAEQFKTLVDPWLYVAEAAALANVSAKRWRNGLGQIPAAGRRCPDTGRRQWQASVVRAYVARRDAGATRQGVDRHRQISALLAWVRAEHGGEPTMVGLAAALDIHPRTVAYHLNGRCSCDPAVLAAG